MTARYQKEAWPSSKSILETIGRTPVVRIRKLAPAHVKLYVKVEAFNPLGSVKDRLALGLIEDAERNGKKGTGMLAKAVEVAEANGWFLCRQFENEAAGKGDVCPVLVAYALSLFFPPEGAGRFEGHPRDGRHSV